MTKGWVIFYGTGFFGLVLGFGELIGFIPRDPLSHLLGLLH